MIDSALLHLYHVDELFDRPRRLLQRRVFFRRELDLDDLFDASRAEFYRDTDEQIMDAVLALKEN